MQGELDNLQRLLLARLEFRKLCLFFKFGGGFLMKLKIEGASKSALTLDFEERWGSEWCGQFGLKSNKSYQMWL